MDPASALTRPDGSPITVLDVDNHSVPMTALWQSHTVIIVFVRHFLCIDCQVRPPAHSPTNLSTPHSSLTDPPLSARWQEYFRAIWTAFLTTDYAAQNVRLIIIGCGTPKLARSLAEDLNAFAHPSFSIYTDPDRQAYTALGLIYKTQFDVGRCLRGMVFTAQKMLTKCWCMCSSGDPRQNGGVFVLEKDTGRSLFAHIDQQPNDHAPVEQVLKAAGLHVTGAP